jgi:peptide methionine sulfoxide reductase MsrB
MYLIDDIDSFEPRASKILSQGLSPKCDHGGFDEGVFCCMGCQTPIFDKDYLIHEASLIYSFRRPLAFHLFDYRFEASSVFPKICIDCVNCGHAIGYIESAWKSDEKTFYVISRSVYLETK